MGGFVAGIIAILPDDAESASLLSSYGGGVAAEKFDDPASATPFPVRKMESKGIS